MQCPSAVAAAGRPCISAYSLFFSAFIFLFGAHSGAWTPALVVRPSTHSLVVVTQAAEAAQYRWSTKAINPKAVYLALGFAGSPLHCIAPLSARAVCIPAALGGVASVFLRTANRRSWLTCPFVSGVRNGSTKRSVSVCYVREVCDTGASARCSSCCCRCFIGWKIELKTVSKSKVGLAVSNPAHEGSRGNRR